MAKNNRPIIEFTAGRVRASVWYDEVTKKTNESFSVFTTRVEKRFKDAQGKWQSSGSFGRQDLADLELVVLAARQYVSLNEHEPQGR